jgi:hypothetical protein
MANRFLILVVITIVGLISLTQCVNETPSYPKKTDPLSTVNPNFNPNSTIAGNNSFIVNDTASGSVVLLDSITLKKYHVVRGKCDCDTVSQCNYYIISGYFETADSIKKGKASFNVYFTKKPTVSMDYKIITFLTDTTNKLVYTLDDASVFLKVTEIAKTHKTFGGIDGLLHVTVTDNLPFVSFTHIKGKNLSNISDTTFLSGKLKCLQ